jgi:serine protease Do
MIKRLLIVILLCIIAIITALILIKRSADSPVLSAEKIYDEVAGSVYVVKGKKANGDVISTGGAVAVTESFLATNCHIIKDVDHFSVLINKSDKDGELYSEQDDVCLIQVKNEKFHPVALRKSSTVNIGENVYAVGNPEEFNKSISNGIISNKHVVRGMTMLQTTAPISPGSSGGGLFDVHARLIGITSGSWDDNRTQNINFALPTELIEVAMTEPEKAKAGVEVTSTEQDKTQAKAAQDLPKKSEIKIIQYYGEDRVVLVQRGKRCFIGIPGRNSTGSIVSAILWLPDVPNGMFIFSKTTLVEKMFKFLDWTDQHKNVKLVESKSYLFYNESLKPLDMYVVDGDPQTVYIFAQDNSLTETFMLLDSFIAQFYEFNEKNKMTTIVFGLNGFSEAFGEYKKQCEKEATHDQPGEPSAPR